GAAQHPSFGDRPEGGQKPRLFQPGLQPALCKGDLTLCAVCPAPARTGPVKSPVHPSCLKSPLLASAGSARCFQDFASQPVLWSAPGCSQVLPGTGRGPLPAAGSVGLRLALSLPSFLVFLRYLCYYEYPLLTYLEYPILIAQDVLLLLCVFHFNGNVKGAAPYLALCVASWFVLSLQKWIIDLAMNLSTFISTASKFAQLQCLWKTQDSGAVSALTWSLASYTCAARIITTLMTTSDLTVLMRFVIMLALNLWVTATVLRYRTTVGKAE
uniref:Solute carrier family 66 member 3 n=1 Tax=Canis lupus familiaris TaxID=9615 RepID=A0A8P0PI25_CANLF